MNCAEIQALLSAYIDDECDPGEKNLIQAHLDTCPECMKAYIWIKKIVEDLNDIDELDVPEGFHEDLMQKIQGEPSSKKRIPRFSYRYSIAAASLFLTLVFGLLGVQMFKEILRETQKSTESVMVADATMETATTATYEMAAEESAGITSDSSGDQQSAMMLSESADMATTAEAPQADSTLNGADSANSRAVNESSLTETTGTAEPPSEGELSAPGDDSLKMSKNVAVEQAPAPLTDTAEEAATASTAEESSTVLTASSPVESVGTDAYSGDAAATEATTYDEAATADEGTRPAEDAPEGVQPATVILLAFIVAMFLIPGKFFNVTRYYKSKNKKDDYKR